MTNTKNKQKPAEVVETVNENTKVETNKNTQVKNSDEVKISKVQLDQILKQNAEFAARLSKIEEEKKIEKSIENGKEVLINMVTVRMIDGQIVTDSEFSEIKTEKDEMNQDQTVQYRKYFYGDGKSKILSGRKYRTTTEKKELELLNVTVDKDGKKYVIASDENGKEYKVDYSLINA